MYVHTIVHNLLLAIIIIVCAYNNMNNISYCTYINIYNINFTYTHCGLCESDSVI